MCVQFTARPLLDSQAEVGEGPLWDHQRQVLWWVDIEQGRIHRFDPATAKNKSFDVGQRVGTVVCRERGGLMLAVASGFAAYDPDRQELEIIVDPEADLPDNRFNDGKCDPAGRFWAGTMHLDPEKHTTGALYSLDAEGNVKRHLTGVGVSNGIVWSADARTMYYADSLAGSIDAFDYDLQSGEISNRRSIFNVPGDLGCADGMAIDEHDHLWVAFWGGWCVACIDPSSGKILAKVSLPVAQTSACAFGGERLDELYITTARQGLSEAALAQQPLAGNLFLATPAVRGTRSTSYAG